MQTLYGDGIHDDTLAIQELIDSGACEVTLPAPKKFYLISKPLEIHSNFRLVLPRFAEVRLAKGSNCVMLRTRAVYDHAQRLSLDRSDGERFTWGYVDDFAPVTYDNIELCGGIWNCNNMEQNPNPQQSHDYSVREFYGFAMLFYNVKNLKISDLTIKDPTNFGITLDTVSYFTVENITFDYNLGNPRPINMDGVHLNGNCHFGLLRNLKGTCYDDLVALNADEGTGGDITDIEIDGIFAEDCHSAARLLTVKYAVERIHISNVYGTYYQYCLGLTKYYKGESAGYYDAITFDNIYASKAVRYPHIYDPNSYVYALIWIDKQTLIKSLTIRSLHRKEHNNPIDTIHVRRETVVERMILDDVTTENLTDSPMPFIGGEGRIINATLRDVRIGDDPITLVPENISDK